MGGGTAKCPVPLCFLTVPSVTGYKTIRENRIRWYSSAWVVYSMHCIQTVTHRVTLPSSNTLCYYHFPLIGDGGTGGTGGTFDVFLNDIASLAYL